jgi:hypothetical protein
LDDEFGELVDCGAFLAEQRNAVLIGGTGTDTDGGFGLNEESPEGRDLQPRRPGALFPQRRRRRWRVHVAHRHTEGGGCPVPSGMTAAEAGARIVRVGNASFSYRPRSTRSKPGEAGCGLRQHLKTPDLLLGGRNTAA